MRKQQEQGARELQGVPAGLLVPKPRPICPASQRPLMKEVSHHPPLDVATLRTKLPLLEPLEEDVLKPY